MFQSRILRLIVSTPWYFPNEVIQRDENLKQVFTGILLKEVRIFGVHYRRVLNNHPYNKQLFLSQIYAIYSVQLITKYN